MTKNRVLFLSIALLLSTAAHASEKPSTPPPASELPTVVPLATPITTPTPSQPAQPLPQSPARASHATIAGDALSSCIQTAVARGIEDGLRTRDKYQQGELNNIRNSSIVLDPRYDNTQAESVVKEYLDVLKKAHPTHRDMATLVATTATALHTFQRPAATPVASASASSLSTISAASAKSVVAIPSRRKYSDATLEQLRKAERTINTILNEQNQEPTESKEQNSPVTTAPLTPKSGWLGNAAASVMKTLTAGLPGSSSSASKSPAHKQTTK